MIIYGIRIIERKQQFFKEPVCPNCNEGPLKLTFSQKYFHIFWIPTFPLSKPIDCECINCRKKYLEEELPEKLRVECSEQKEKLGRPIYMYSGLFILIALIFYVTISIISNDKNEDKLFHSPKIGDFYNFKFSNSSYFIYRVTDITEDSIQFLTPDFYMNKYCTIEYALSQTNNYFSKQKVSFSKEEIDSLYVSSKIIEIYRPERKAK